MRDAIFYKIMTEEDINQLSNRIIYAAIEVHRVLGPGLLESAYREALFFELKSMDISVVSECPIPLLYKGYNIGHGYRADLIVENEIIIELKATENENKIHERQLLTYLRLSGKRLGLLLNFNREMLRGNIKRIVNNF